MSFADQQDSPCIDCKWRDRVNVCPIFAVECKHANDKDKGKNTRYKGVFKAVDKRVT